MTPSTRTHHTSTLPLINRGSTIERIAKPQGLDGPNLDYKRNLIVDRKYIDQSPGLSVELLLFPCTSIVLNRGTNYVKVQPV